jgi:hypothetical protein
VSGAGGRLTYGRSQRCAGSVRFAYIPDHEPALAGEIADRPADWISGGRSCGRRRPPLPRRQYFQDGYEERIGWGHSSIADTVAFAEALGARRLLLFHHDPMHSDRSLERLEETARSLARGNGLTPTLAREGMVVDLP